MTKNLIHFFSLALLLAGGASASDNYHAREFQIHFLSSDGKPIEHVSLTVRNKLERFHWFWTSYQGFDCLPKIHGMKWIAETVESKPLLSNQNGVVHVAKTVIPVRSPLRLIKQGADIEVAIGHGGNELIALPLFDAQGRRRECPVHLSNHPGYRHVEATLEKLKRSASLPASITIHVPISSETIEQESVLALENCRKWPSLQD